ncbi:MAG: SapC family protein [Pseudomonadota bacterium]|nr:SapC family protein [Pseudomonadota bacterium]
MVNRVVLNNQIHRDVRIAATRPTRENAELNAVSVIPREFPRLLAHYPIFYTKNTETGRFELSALLGFQAQENLFFAEDRWEAAYVPLQIQRLPFSLMTRGVNESAGKPTLDVALDLSQTVQSPEGQRLFLEDGQPTKFLQDTTSMLSALVAGANETYAFTGRLAELNLIESVQIDIEFVDGSETKLQGLYWIAAAALKALPAAQLAELRDREFLEWMYFQMASIAHVSALVARKNRRLSGVTAARA